MYYICHIYNLGHTNVDRHIDTIQYIYTHTQYFIQQNNSKYNK